MVDHEVENTLRELRERVRAAAPPPAATGPDAAAVAVSPRGGPFEALARMEANLATTERAWSRLPPVLSYRRGALARIELAVKRLVKRALHWFTWEQVNFNSAAHQALRDALAALSAHERQLAEARAEMDTLRRRAAAVESLAAELRAELRAELPALRDGLRAELRERLAHLSDEQRVCFRQLSLEATEAAVAHDRARRLLEARLEELERRGRGR